MRFEIKNRFTGDVQFTCELDASFETKSEGEQLGEAVRKAILSGAILSGADLSDAKLSDANLSDAKLSGANLRGANLSDAILSDADLFGVNLRDAKLSGANLSDAILSGADLSGAILSGADLSDANLSDAILSGADLSGADLSGANLSGANLRGADLFGVNLRDAKLSGAKLSGANLRIANLVGVNLRSADLVGIQADLFSKLLLTKNEVLGLYDYLMIGKIDGSCYTGECACFCGTIANIRGELYQEMENGLLPNADSPTERWFLAIRKGDIPQNNQVSAITAEWMREFMDREGIVYPKYEIVAIG